MKILLLNPPFKAEFGRFSREQRSPAITKGGTLYYPTWLCYAGGLLEKNGYEVSIIDAPASRKSLEDVLKQIKEFAPDIAVVDTSTPSIYNDVKIADTLKESGIPFVLLVGTHPSALPDETLKLSEKIDAIARKEYELTLLELAKTLEGYANSPEKEKLETIKGLSFRFNGTVCHNPDRIDLVNPDDLPFASAVYKKHLNVRDYFYTICQYPIVVIYSGRGCPFHCVYCVYPQVLHGHKYRKRSVANLVEEFKYIERELPEVREIFIEDDTFTVDKKRVVEFSQAYQKAGLRISWVANSRADVDLETLQALKKSNCRLLCVGFESGDQRVLDAMKKRLKVDKAGEFVKDAKKVGILVHGCFLLGNPEESKETLETTLNYAKSMSPDTAQFFPIMAYPGTEAYDWAKSNGYLMTEDYSQWNTEEGLHNCVISRPGLSNKDLVDFCDRARQEFYMRPSYILYRLGRLLRHPIEDGPRIFKSFKVFWKFLFAGSTKKEPGC